MDRGQIKKAVLKTLTVMAGYIVLGMGFGILLQVNGYGVLWAAAMSIFIYAGSMQFVGVSLIASGASLITTAVTTLMVNARHLFYGVSMIKKYKGTGLKKLYLMFSLTDETYSLVCTHESSDGEDPAGFYMWVSLLDHIYWVAGSIAGSLIGSVITFDTAGIDFAMTALFVTVFVEQWLNSKEHRPAVIGLTSTAVCLMVFGRDNFLIPSMVIITAVLTSFRKALERRENAGEQ